ncbi:MAG: protein kinase [Parachlamydiaceae bacterium]|nr:protein kinase [Parachlamydiaceae bacterium]
MNKISIILLSFFLTLGSCAFALPTEKKTESSHYQEDQQICSPTECYTIVKKLGEGAFGEVFEVTDSQGNEFALKTYKSREGDWADGNIFSDPEREFLRGQELNHPYIIRSYDLFFHESPENIQTQNLILELVKGKTVSSTLKGTLPVDNAMMNAFQLCEALYHGITFDLIHFDLHDGNVMLTNEGEVKVIDLASFFTFSEILEAFGNLEPVPEKQYYTDKNSNMTHISAKAGIATKQLQPQNAFRMAKLQKIFKGNPELMTQMQKAKAAVQRQTALNRFGALSASSKSESIYIDPVEIYKVHFLKYYFHLVTEICARFISKSELSREERLKLRAEVKKVAWHYEEDLEDGIIMPIDHYFKNLSDFLQYSPL